MADRRLGTLEKKSRDEQAHLVLIDESGLLLAPLVRRCLAPRGRTPMLPVQGAHRRKVSLMAALTLSPRGRRVRLAYRTYPDQYVNSQRAAEFLRDLLVQLRGPVIVVCDQGTMHKGEPIRELRRDFPRLSLEFLPGYAPDLNPVEHLWKHLKYDRLANFAPRTLTELHETILEHLEPLRQNPQRLKRFFAAAHLDCTNTALSA